MKSTSPRAITAPSRLLLALLLSTAPAGAQSLELFEIERVVDGDTIYIQREGERESLRLLSVDTEEKLSGRSFSPDKPETVYGEASAIWAQEFFAARADEQGVSRIGLSFPGGLEERDVYGRLLCHVLLEDGTDFNVLLVRTGRSPYFMKYGHSRIAHAAFVEAERLARAERLGIWNPATNRATTPGAPEVLRPYARLVPWWRARAEAIDNERRLRATGSVPIALSERPDELAQLAELAAEDAQGLVFGAVDRCFEEDDGSLTVLFRGDRQRALRVILAPDVRQHYAHLELPERGGSYRQNYFWARGRVLLGERGYEVRPSAAGALELAGPEPLMPAE